MAAGKTAAHRKWKPKECQAVVHQDVLNPLQQDVSAPAMKMTAPPCRLSVHVVRGKGGVFGVGSSGRSLGIEMSIGNCSLAVQPGESVFSQRRDPHDLLCCAGHRSAAELVLHLPVSALACLLPLAGSSLCLTGNTKTRTHTLIASRKLLLQAQSLRQVQKC